MLGVVVPQPLVTTALYIVASIDLKEQSIFGTIELPTIEAGGPQLLWGRTENSALLQTMKLPLGFYCCIVVGPFSGRISISIQSGSISLYSTACVRGWGTQTAEGPCARTRSGPLVFW